MLRTSLTFLFALWLIMFDAAAAQNTDPTATNSVSPLTIYAGGPPQPIELYTEAMRFTTVLGTIDVGLYRQHAPDTVANFLRYVDEGRYFIVDPTTSQVVPTFIHRAVPNFVIQGGGFLGTVDPDHPENVRPSQLPIFPPIQNEPRIANTRGTVAMAKTDQPNSATSQWFINLGDNVFLDDPSRPTNTGGFTAFGRVLGDGMAVADAIAQVPQYSFNQTFSSLPLRDYSLEDYNSGKSIVPANLVSVPGVERISPTAPLSFSASSNDPSVSVTISGTRLLVHGNHVGSAQVTLTATGPAGATLSETFAVNVISLPGHLANISTRLQVGTNDDVLIAGFIVRGGTSKRLLVRGMGPSLTSNGQPVPGRLADPLLELHGPQKGLIATNNNWADDKKQEIIDTGIAPSVELESAILVTVPSNDDGIPYTAVLQGVNASTGIGSVEVYDLDSGPVSSLVNISTRGQVGTGDNVLIAGFIITGGDSKKVLIRGIGPSLAGSVTGPLANPTIELHDINGGKVDENDDWQSNPKKSEIEATGVAPSDPKESAMIGTLAPSSYTAVIKGVGDTTGVGSIELYQLQ